MHKIPVVVSPVTADDLLLPVSDSLKAATVAELHELPKEPERLHLACIVLQPWGAPGRCVNASEIPADRSEADWDEVILRIPNYQPNQRIKSDIFKAAETRVGLSVLKRSENREPRFEIRFFDVVIDPSDARVEAIPASVLATKDIVFAKPINGSLLTAFYPTVALRHSVEARVTMTCLIEDSRRLLCLDPGTVELSNASMPELVRAFRLATYQIASSFDLAERDKAGNLIMGKALKFTIVWKLPAG